MKFHIFSEIFKRFWFLYAQMYFTKSLYVLMTFGLLGLVYFTHLPFSLILNILDLLENVEFIELFLTKRCWNLLIKYEISQSITFWNIDFARFLTKGCWNLLIKHEISQSVSLLEMLDFALFLIKTCRFLLIKHEIS